VLKNRISIDMIHIVNQSLQAESTVRVECLTSISVMTNYFVEIRSSHDTWPY